MTYFFCLFVCLFVCLFLLFQAAVTIYVPYDGIVKELMYEVDDVATAGQPLLTIELAEEEDEGEWCSYITVDTTSCAMNLSS